MKLKKILAASLAMCLAAGALAGCGGGEESGKVETLKWYVCCQQQEDEQMVEDKVNELLAGKINAKVDLEFIPQNSYTQKMNMIISSGEEFDLCFTSNWALNFVESVRKGAFKSLDELLNEYGKDIKEQVPKEFLDMAKVDGVQYAIPNYQVMVSQMGLLTYPSLAEKYNFDMSTIKEIKDLEPYLEVIKQNEPDKIPYRFDQGENYTIKPKYEEVAGQCSYLPIDGEDYQLVYPEEELKELHKMYCDWYDKGYIRKDVATYSDDTTEAQNGRYAFWGVGVTKPGFDMEIAATYGETPVYTTFGDPYIARDAACATMTAISRTCKKPELAMQLINIVYADKEIYNTLCYGVEGVHYTKTGDNMIDYIEGGETYKPTRDWMFGNQFNAYVIEGKDPDVWEKTLEYNESAKVSRITGFYFDKTDVVTEMSAVSKVVKEYQTMLRGACGAANFEQQWADYQAKLDVAGRKKIQEEIQRQLDEWVKNVKNK